MYASLLCFGITTVTIFVALLLVYRRLAQNRARPDEESTLEPPLKNLGSSPTQWLVSANTWFERLCARSGVPVEKNVLLLVIVLMSIIVGSVAFVVELPVPTVMLVAILGCTVGMSILYVVMLRRIGKFQRQFPVALELMSRATRAGANFESAMRIASDSSDEPLKSEFRQCVKQVHLGLAPSRAITELAKRIGTADVELLAHTVGVHSRVGGKLAIPLERLSSIIRDRSEFADKMRSATGTARFAIFAVVAIGAFVLLYLHFAEPEYLQKLTLSPLGKKMILYAIGSEIVGVIWVLVTLRVEN